MAKKRPRLLVQALKEVTSHEAIQEINAARISIKCLVENMNSLDWEEKVIKEAAYLAKTCRENYLYECLCRILKGKHIVSRATTQPIQKKIWICNPKKESRLNRAMGKIRKFEEERKNS